MKNDKSKTTGMVKLKPNCNVRYSGVIPEYDAVKVQSKSQPGITLVRSNNYTL